MKRFALLVGILGLGSAATSNAPWPELPQKGFIVGRPATEDDVKRGNAVFSMAGTSKGALDIKIPQYVLRTDEAGNKHPMILVQAEHAQDGSEIVGLRDFAGKETVATLAEVTLLGTKKPK